MFVVWKRYTPSILSHIVKSMCPIHFPLPAVHRTKQACWEILHWEARSTQLVLVLLCQRAFYLVFDLYYNAHPCDVLMAAWEWMSVLLLSKSNMTSTRCLTGNVSVRDRSKRSQMPFETAPVHVPLPLGPQLPGQPVDPDENFEMWKRWSRVANRQIVLMSFPSEDFCWLF